MGKQQRPEAKLNAQQHKQHQQRNRHHDIRRHHYHKQHAADERLTAKAIAIQCHRGEGTDQRGEGGGENRHRQRVLSGLQQTVIIHQQAVPVGGKALPVDAEA